MRVLGDVPQNIHFKDRWSKMFCRVGGSVSSAIWCAGDWSIQQSLPWCTGL